MEAHQIKHDLLSRNDQVQPELDDLAHPTDNPVASDGDSSCGRQQEDNDSCRIVDEPLKHQYHVFKYWEVQIFSVVLAGGLVGAQFAILTRFDLQPVPDWGLPININTLLALLSTIYRGLLITTLSHIISQAKWEWFGRRKDRPLQDLQDFDDGSRGPYGAARLLTAAGKNNVIASAAAFLILISFAISPFVQQAIKTMECDSPVSGSASIQYAHYVPRQGGFVRGITGWAPADPDTNVMVCSSITAPDGIENQIHPSCTTGNCSFPYGDPMDSGKFDTTGHETSYYSTVGLCHACMNVTSLVSLSATNQYHLPNGQKVVANASDGVVLNVTTDADLIWAKDVINPQLSVASRWSLANLTVFTISQAGCHGNNLSNAKAATCITYPCIRTYTASVYNGDLTENFVRSALMFPEVPTAQAQALNGRINDIGDYIGVQLPCNVGGDIYTSRNISSAPMSVNMTICVTQDDGPCKERAISAPEACIYRHSAKFASAISQILEDNYLTGGCNVSSGALNCRTKSSGEGPGRYLELLYNRQESSSNGSSLWDGRATEATIESYFEKFATAMTNGYRTRFAGGEYDAAKARDNAPLARGDVQGVVWKTTVCMSVQLQWLILPTAIVLFTSVLLAWAFIQSWRLRDTQPVWKESLLPLIFYRELFQPYVVSSPAGAEGQPLMETNEMKTLAKRICVSFRFHRMPTHDNEDPKGSRRETPKKKTRKE